MNIKDEQELFDIIKLKLIEDLELNEYKYSPTDAHSKKLNLHIEFKCRNKHYPTLILEKSKYDSMMKKKKVRYINSTPQGVYSINPKKLKNIRWISMWLPKTTFWNSVKILKEVTLIPIEVFKDITDKLK